jgi:hypothetical protein
VKIAISLPIHENIAVVLDQIDNIRYFVPNSIIVIHVSKQFTGWKGHETSDLERFDNVTVNPIRMGTSLGLGVQCDIHLSNFKHVREIENIDYFNLHSSNELFVTHGMDAYVRDFDAGFFNNKVFESESKGWAPGKCALMDRVLLDMMYEQGIGHMLVSQIEGSFYKSDVFERVFGVIRNAGGNVSGINRIIGNSTLQRIPHFNGVFQKAYNRARPNRPLYPKEEVYFPTVASKFSNKVGYPYCYANWRRNLLLSTDEIDACISGEMSKSTEVEKASEMRFFTVKRVPRVMDDPIRAYVHEIMRR